VRRRAWIVSVASIVALGCETARNISLPTIATTSSTPNATPSTNETYAAKKTRIAKIRAALASELTGATTDASRRATIDRARVALQGAIVDTLFPAWLGTDWAFDGTTEEPRGDDGIACGYFVATILEHAGVRLESRRRFGQATALAIEKALVPDATAHHRVFSVAPEILERRFRDWGDGLYVIGLDVHVGFVVVKGGAVRFVHASYTGDKKVTDEPLVSSVAIAHSRPAGYFVTSLLGPDSLVLAWLRRTTIDAPT
jgi:hypothetical protein